MSHGVSPKQLEQRLEKAYALVGESVRPELWAKICVTICPESFRAKKPSAQKTIEQRAKSGQELFHPDDSPPLPKEIPTKNKNKKQEKIYFLIEPYEGNDED